MMIFKTIDGLQYAVDLKTRELASWNPNEPPLKFHELTGVYVGSRSVRFRDVSGRHVLHITDEVVSVEGSPLDAVVADEGNTLIITKNSVYEINQEQKLVRKLAGLNPPTESLSPLGDWRPYERIEGLQVGRMGLIYYPGLPNKPLLITHIREIKGTVVESPEPGVLAVSIALVKAEMPSRLD